MLSEIDFSADITIVQFGSGKAVFQKNILQKMSKNSKLYVFEIDPKSHKFVEEINDGRYYYIKDFAENANQYIKNVDVVISTLPFGSMPKHLCPKIISEARNILKNH